MKLQKFAGEGLRTLCLAIRDVDEAYFEDWKDRHHEASVTIKSREERLDKLYEEIEQNLTLLGATAIEDKLQDGVSRFVSKIFLNQAFLIKRGILFRFPRRLPIWQ